ncbi:MAG: polysaccharide biosynthesis tyrosine autokinase [Planctomycetes bacterium]|nr:polysaccharide biosynthesis tyrosine autokinase [Planctomycetota bacterium]
MDAFSPSSPMTPPPQGDGASLVQVLLILRRRWRLMAIVWAATIAAVGIYTFTSKRLYRPQASLEIQPERPLVSGDSNDPALMASRMMWENYYRTQEAILTGPTLMETAYKALPEPIRAKFKDAPDPVKAFMDRLDIEKIRTSFILKVGFIDEDREAATQVVNTIVSIYLEDANRRFRDLKSGAAEVLSKETLPSIRARVDEADKALQGFQTETRYIDFEEHYKSLVEAHRKFDARFTDIRLQRLKVMAELESLSSYGAEGVSGLFNPAFHSTTALQPLAQERARIASDLGKIEKLYKERHPAVQELREQLRMVEDKIREAIRGTLKFLETELAQAEGEEKSLREELQAVEKGMADSARRLNQFRRLESELVSAKELYNSYLKKHGETTATSGSSLGSVRVVDHATVPVFPFKPRVMMNLGLAAVVGLLLGAAAIFLTEQLDDRIQSPREVEAFVGLDVLAMIPRLSLAAKAGADPILLGEESGLPEFEAFRGLRAEIVTRLERVEGSRVVCVLSALQSEGKSTVTANLAKVLAMEGRRVLVFDADLRRPSQCPLIGNPSGPGFEEVLRGSATVDKAVQKSRIPGVDVLGAKAGTSGAAELAGTPLFEEALQWARANYDFVLIDSAPVNQVSESALVARRADATLLVIREGQTGRGAAVMARKRLQGMGVKVAGVVLNCAVPHGRGYGYYYYSYYAKD